MAPSVSRSTGALGGPSSSSVRSSSASLVGYTVSEAAAKIRKAIREFYVRDPDVRVGIAQMPRIQVWIQGATFVRGWVTRRHESESFAAFATRLSDDDLGSLAGLEPARRREREEEAA